MLKDNEESEETSFFLRAGVNVTSALTLEANFSPLGNYKRTATEYNTIQTSKMQLSTSTVQTTTSVGGSTTVQTTQSIGGNSQTVYSNALTITEFSCDVTTLGGQMNYRYASGGTLSLGVFQHSYKNTSAPTNSSGQVLTNKIEGASFIGAALTINGKPTLITEAAVTLSRDAIPSLKGPIAAHAVDLRGLWDVMDPWEISGHAGFSSLSDDNSLLQLNARSLWRLSEEQGFYAGFGGEFSNAGNKSPDYWSPHWLERFYAMAEIRRSSAKTFFMIGLRYGWGRQSGWPVDVERYNENLTNGQLYGYYPGPNPDKDWASIVGLNASFTKKFWRFWEFNFNGSVGAMEDYMSHNVAAELIYHF